EKFYYHRGMNERVAKDGVSWPHYHSLYEIYFLEEGNCTYIIDNKLYNIQSGDIVIIPDGVIHHTKYDNIKHSRILINCTREHIPDSLQSIISSGKYFYRNPFIADEIRKTLEKIENEYNIKDSFSDEIISCYTNSLLYLILRNTESCVDIDDVNKVIEQAVAYIRENFSSNITLSSLAKRYSLSPEHFSRLFKKETGLGFSKYLNSLRLQYAEQLLRNSEGQSVTRVAEICGFEDSNYFSKKFKEVYGTSPKKLQKKYKSQKV
ncbi:MAG: helix-turn-helix transcriptional regulator, partial [Clostridia bacterium]|nr:helix-turn-helix transcriptional regulator [Clostridia bacterium]